MRRRDSGSRRQDDYRCRLIANADFLADRPLIFRMSLSVTRECEIRRSTGQGPDKLESHLRNVNRQEGYSLLKGLNQLVHARHKLRERGS
jgi:hypothetical protein